MKKALAETTAKTSVAILEKIDPKIGVGVVAFLVGGFIGYQLGKPSTTTVAIQAPASEDGKKKKKGKKGKKDDADK